MAQKPCKCICYSKPRFRSEAGGWRLVCSCGRSAGVRSNKQEAVQAWAMLIRTEREGCHA